MKHQSIVVLGLTAILASSAHGGFGDLFKSAEDYLSGNKSESTTGTSSILSDADIGSGLREALSIGAERAVALLGKSGGFLNDQEVRIPLPGMLKTAGDSLRRFGYGQVVDDFETTVNDAAEQAIPETLQIVKNTVSNMTMEDVKGILNGGDDAATQFLKTHAGADLRQAILPIVSSATDKAGATAAYKRLKDQLSASMGGFLSPGALDLDGYVADKTLDGLFLKLAREEKQIRENPLARTTDLLKQVFGQ